MRSKKALYNTIAGLLYEFVAVICGFILPRLILSAFGSDYNGVTSSITQFLGYVALMRAGIGGVTRAALYKPLAEGNTEKISAVVNATEQFLKKVAIIFLFSLIALALIYPFFIIKNFDYWFSFSLVIILGISTFSQYYFGLTYQLLLNADQRQCVISYVQIFSTILNTLVAFILIKIGSNIHIVKLGSTIVFSLNPIIINWYARKKYKIDKTVKPNKDALAERWDCFGLQVANFVNSNTDMFVLTIFTNVFEVSVYTVYYMVTNGIRKILLTFVNGVGAAFGNMFAKNEEKLIYKNLFVFEQVTFSLSNIFFGTTIVMILSFVNIYTHNINDANYIRPDFAIILIIATLFGCYRIPYQSIVEAVGHFKKTRNGSFFEAMLNIVLSVVLVNFLGLVGVAIGTLSATVFRTFQYAAYMSKNLIKRSMVFVYKRILISFFEISAISGIGIIFKLNIANSIFEWILKSFTTASFAVIIVLVFEIVFYKNDFYETRNKIKNALKRRHRHERKIKAV
ncbi:MAG: polysaccharide biosynthesis C-terminal domain-containing protein [Bacilli bacterium]|nr:polysaccharide biosynthesis C-terminal domain-containing protein [Bacilli bacterium]